MPPPARAVSIVERRRGDGDNDGSATAGDPGAVAGGAGAGARRRRPGPAARRLRRLAGHQRQRRGHGVRAGRHQRRRPRLRLPRRRARRPGLQAPGGLLPRARPARSRPGAGAARPGGSDADRFPGALCVRWARFLHAGKRHLPRCHLPGDVPGLPRDRRACAPSTPPPDRPPWGADPGAPTRTEAPP